MYKGYLDVVYPLRFLNTSFWCKFPMQNQLEIKQRLLCYVQSRDRILRCIFFMEIGLKYDLSPFFSNKSSGNRQNRIRRVCYLFSREAVLHCNFCSKSLWIFAMYSLEICFYRITFLWIWIWVWIWFSFIFAFALSLAFPLSLSPQASKHNINNSNL